MAKRSGTTERSGRVYRFTVDGKEYAAFIWQNGAQFRGRVDAHAHIPMCSGRTAITVRDALLALVAADTGSMSHALAE